MIPFPNPYAHNAVLTFWGSPKGDGKEPASRGAPISLLVCCRLRVFDHACKYPGKLLARVQRSTPLRVQADHGHGDSDSPWSSIVRPELPAYPLKPSRVRRWQKQRATKPTSDYCSVDLCTRQQRRILTFRRRGSTDRSTRSWIPKNERSRAKKHHLVFSITRASSDRSRIRIAILLAHPPGPRTSKIYPERGYAL